MGSYSEKWKIVLPYFYPRPSLYIYWKKKDAEIEDILDVIGRINPKQQPSNQYESKIGVKMSARHANKNWYAM